MPPNDSEPSFQISPARNPELPSPRNNRPGSAESTVPRGCGHRPKHSPIYTERPPRVRITIPSSSVPLSYSKSRSRQRVSSGEARGDEKRVWSSNHREFPIARPPSPALQKKRRRRRKEGFQNGTDSKETTISNRTLHNQTIPHHDLVLAQYPSPRQGPPSAPGVARFDAGKPRCGLFDQPALGAPRLQMPHGDKMPLGARPGARRRGGYTSTLVLPYLRCC